jgi:hypothetical protein
MARARASDAGLVQVTAGSGRSRPSMNQRIAAAGSKRRPTGQSGDPYAQARRYRRIEILVGVHTLTAADLLPGDVDDALTASASTHVRSKLTPLRSR